MLSDVRIFHVPVGHLHVFFGKMPTQALCPFFSWILCFLILSYVRSLCSFGINPLLDISFVYMFHRLVFSFC